MHYSACTVKSLYGCTVNAYYIYVYVLEKRIHNYFLVILKLLVLLDRKYTFSLSLSLSLSPHTHTHTHTHTGSSPHAGSIQQGWGSSEEETDRVSSDSGRSSPYWNKPLCCTLLPWTVCGCVFKKVHC